MARPRIRTRRSYEELLKENEEKLGKYQEAIKALEKERTELLKAKREEELQELYCYMQENDLSAEEVLENLRGTEKEIAS